VGHWFADHRRPRIPHIPPAGQERFRAITAAYYRGAIAAMITYDVTQYETFAHVSSWLKQLREYADPKVVCMLVGNKTDLRHLRTVSTEEGAAFASLLHAATVFPLTTAEDNGMLFTETSCENGSNVIVAFQNLITETARQVMHIETQSDVIIPPIRIRDDRVQPRTLTTTEHKTTCCSSL
jgi:Ras-related protein Rab-11A